MVAFLSVARTDFNATLLVIKAKARRIMNYSKSLISIPWYQALNHSTVPCFDSMNVMPDRLAVYDTFAHNFGRIAEMLKFGVEQNYISKERIQTIVKTDFKTVEGMKHITDVLNNDFWIGFSGTVNQINKDISERYNRVMPTALKENFNSAVACHLGNQSLHFGKSDSIKYDPLFFGITININDIYLSSFNLSKYSFNGRVGDAFATLIHKTMSHQLETPVCFADGDSWLKEEYLDGREVDMQAIYAYWLEHDKDHYLDVEQMLAELKITGLEELFDVADLSILIGLVEIEQVENEFIKLTSKKAVKSCFKLLKSEAKKDKALASLLKMVKHLPTEPYHHATESQGDLDVSNMAMYGFDTPLELDIVESAFDRAWQTGELAVLSLEASQVGLSFMQNFLETLYLKSFIQVFLDYIPDSETLNISDVID